MTTDKLAHESDDDTMPVHCPWDGSGQVLANSDGSIRCNNCQRSFTIRLQPSYPGIPQDPNQMNAGEPQLTGDPNAQQSVQPVTADDPAAQQPSPAQPPAPPTPPEDDEEDQPQPPYRTMAGSLLAVDDYLDHLAIATATDRPAMIAAVRKRRQAARA